MSLLERILRALDHNQVSTCLGCGVATYTDGWFKRDYPSQTPHTCNDQEAPKEVRTWK